MGHNTTIVIGGPSFGGFSGLGGLGLGGSGLGGISPFSLGGFGGSGLTGSSPFNTTGLGNSGSGIPGLDGTLFKLGFDAMRGDLASVIKDIADLGALLSNFAGGQNASGAPPLPSNFGGGGGGSPAATGGGQPCANSGCQGGQQSEEERINELMKQLLAAFGPLLQALSQLLSLMADSTGNSNSINSSLSQSRFGALQV